MLFSQRVIATNNDTLICFTPEQCKVILKEFNLCNYFDSLTRLQTVEIILMKNSISELKELADLKTSQLKFCQDLGKIKEVEIERLVSQKKQLGKEIKRQSNHKIIAIVSGSITTALMTYLWITK
jgi:hypothetical protein